MDERIKKALIYFLWQSAIAAAIFMVICILKWTVPQVFDKCSVVWKKSTDLKKAGGLLISFFKEIIPF